MSFLSWAKTGLNKLFGGNTTTRRPRASSVYRGADRSRLRSDWNITGGYSTPQSYDLTTLRNRSRDLIRNDPVASGTADTMTINISGGGLKFQSRIRHDRLGISEEKCLDIQNQAEDIFNRWCPYADSAGILTFAEIQFLTLRKIFEDGEALAIPIWIDDEPWRPFGRALELIEADRLAFPSGSVSEKNRNGDPNDSGIYLGERGQPVAYSIRKKGITEFAKIPARDNNGRPMVLHVYPSKRFGQLRGLPFLTPALSMFKDLADTIEAKVVNARVAACLGIIMTSKNPELDAEVQTTETETSTNRRLRELAPGLIQYAEEGLEPFLVDPGRLGNDQLFLEQVLRLVGVALNLPYELLMKDFSKTNYSSARAALLECRRMFTFWRTWFSQRFCQPTLELVLEEAWWRGEFDVPDFMENRYEYCRAAWVGNGWGWVDPVKEIEAARMAVDYNLSTLAHEITNQGGDPDDVLRQRAKEKKMERDLGISPESSGATVDPETPAVEREESAATRRRKAIIKASIEEKD
jgi:lambda family phage portal protein